MRTEVRKKKPQISQITQIDKKSLKNIDKKRTLWQQMQ